MGNPTERFEPGCRLYLQRGANARLIECILQQCEYRNLRKDVYAHTGYIKTEDSLVFLNANCSITKDGISTRYNVDLDNGRSGYGFSTEKDDDRYETVFRVLPHQTVSAALAPSHILYALLGYTFLTPLNSIMRENRHEPSFLLYLIGRTGTFKTTLAKLFLCFFGQFDSNTAPPISFRDTPNAIERKLAMYADVLCLADDKFPPSTPQSKARMEENEQTLARAIGDRGSRGRLNADTSLKNGYVAKGNVIVTAEDAFGNIGESGIARSVSVELKPDDVNKASLTYLQKHSSHLNQCMAEYIQFVVTHHDELKGSLLEQFETFRDKALQELPGQHARLAEAISHLQMGIIGLCMWLLSIKPECKDDVDCMLQESWESFKTLATEQNNRVADEKPTTLFINALADMYVSQPKRFRTLRGGKSFSTDNSTQPTIAFHDVENKCMYLTGEAYSAVLDYYSRQDKRFPLTRDALHKHLKDEGLIEPGKTQITVKKRIDGKNTNYLKMPECLIIGSINGELTLEEGGE